MVTVKPNALLTTTLQTPAATLVFNWQFERSKLQPASESCATMAYIICNRTISLDKGRRILHRGQTQSAKVVG